MYIGFFIEIMEKRMETTIMGLGFTVASQNGPQKCMGIRQAFCAPSKHAVEVLMSNSHVPKHG